MTIGQQIKAARTSKKWTQEALARKMEYSTTYVSNVERGEYLPSHRALVAFSRALNVRFIREA